VSPYAEDCDPMAEAGAANHGRLHHQFSSRTFLRNDDKKVAAASPKRQEEWDRQRQTPDNPFCVRNCRI
jgi:hypothetical protein